MQKHYEALYGLLALISIELANEEVVVDLIRLVLAVQVGPGWQHPGRQQAHGQGLSWPSAGQVWSSSRSAVVGEPGNAVCLVDHGSGKIPLALSGEPRE